MAGPPKSYQFTNDFILLFLDRVFLCSFVCPGLASASHLLGSQACTNTASSLKAYSNTSNTCYV